MRVTKKKKTKKAALNKRKSPLPEIELVDSADERTGETQINAAPAPFKIKIAPGAPPQADFIFVPTDAHGTPGDLNTAILRSLGMFERDIPDERELARGYAAVTTPRKSTLIFIVTIDGDQPTDALLFKNLSACLRIIKLGPALTIWLPLMGTGAGRLSLFASARIILNAVADAQKFFFDHCPLITLVPPQDINPKVLAKIRNETTRVFDPDVQVGEEEEKDEKPAAARFRDAANMQYDRPTNEDNLGRAEFAKSLATRINRLVSPDSERDRSSSLMIQLHAPWGAGKTSFMHLLSERLSDGPEKWVVVWFNAWENQRINPPWWMLYDAIFRTLVKSPRPADNSAAPTAGDILPGNERLWLRISEFFWRLTVGNAVNLSLIVLGILVVSTLLYFAPERWYDKPLAGLVALIGLLSTVGGIVRTGMGNLAAGTSRAAKGFVELTGDPMRKLRQHYEWILDKADRRVLVIVDDLDRCTHSYVVQLLEGVQTIFAHPRVVWVVAADRRWLATAFEESFPKADTVAEPGNRLGYQFLEKAFQVAISLPRITNQTKENYWRRIVGDTLVSVAAGEAAARVAQLENDLAMQSSEGGVLEILEKSASLPPEQTGQLRRAAVERMAAADIEASVQHFLTPFCPLIKSNPRAMKRLVNSYTIFRDLAVLSGMDLSEQSGRRHELARWTILTMDAPLLLDLLEEQPALLKTAKGRAPKTLPDRFQPLWRDPRIERLIYGYEPIELGPLKVGIVNDFSPLRG